MATEEDLKAKLKEYDLSFLYDLLVAKVLPNEDVKGADLDKVLSLIEADPATKVAYDDRFKGNALRIKNGMKALDPSDYIAAEKNYIDTLRGTGMPFGFYDSKEDLAKFIGSDLSRVELEKRIVNGYISAQSADPATKASLFQLYKINESDLAAYYLDPTQAIDNMNRKKDAALFGKQIQAAEIAGQAGQQAKIGLTAKEAESLALQGVTETTARQGFGQIATQQGLFQAQMAGEEAISQQEQIGAAFGTNAAAAQRIAQRRRKRQAEFESGGTFAAGQKGVSGLSSANQ